MSQAELVEIARLPHREVADMRTPHTLPLDAPTNGKETNKKKINQTCSARKPQQDWDLRVQHTGVATAMRDGQRVQWEPVSIFQHHTHQFWALRGQAAGKKPNSSSEPRNQTDLKHSPKPAGPLTFSLCWQTSHPQPWPFQWNVVTPNYIFHFLK